MPKILLVEDNEMNIDMISRRLQKRGFTVAIARTGNEALTKAVSEQPELVLMDLGLPDLDGREVTKRLKADPATVRLPIIALTAQALESERKSALEAGCDDYHAKPLELPRLVEQIQALLNRDAQVG